MTESIKFTEEELKEINELREASQAKVVEFGQLKLERLLTNQRIENLEKLEETAETEYIELQQKEAQLVNKFNDKYGVGTVDLASGVFVPSK